MVRAASPPAYVQTAARSASVEAAGRRQGRGPSSLRDGKRASPESVTRSAMFFSDGAGAGSDPAPRTSPDAGSGSRAGPPDFPRSPLPPRHDLRHRPCRRGCPCRRDRRRHLRRFRGAGRRPRPAPTLQPTRRLTTAPRGGAPRRSANRRHRRGARSICRASHSGTAVTAAPLITVRSRLRQLSDNRARFGA